MKSSAKGRQAKPVAAYSASELLALLTDRSFRSAEVYGDLAGTPYDNKAERLIVIAQK